VTKPSTTPATNRATTAPLASPTQRPKFTFTIANKAANKGSKPDPSKAKQNGEKGENLGMQTKLGSSTDVNAPSEIKSPIASSDKRTETVTQSESSQTPAKIDGSSVDDKSHESLSQKEKAKRSSEESVSSKKEEKGKVISSPKKPRPPPLFIPRAVVQGKGTPQSACKSLYLSISQVVFQFSPGPLKWNLQALKNDCRKVISRTVKNYRLTKRESSKEKALLKNKQPLRRPRSLSCFWPHPMSSQC